MDKQTSVPLCSPHIDSYEERRKKVRQFNMTSDAFFGKVMEDRKACEEVVRILLENPGIKVREVKAQYSIRNMESHSIVLDILAEDEYGNLINVEMQIRNEGDHQRRVRYYQVGIDMSCLEKGVSYDELPDVYIIFITEKDFLKHNTGIYYVERRLRDLGSVIDNGIHEVYANLEHKCTNEKINEILSYMKNSDSHYETMLFPNVVKKVRFLKEEREGVETMCRILEEERNEGRKEGSERINELNRKLVKDRRESDILRALEEPAYQETLLREYNL